MPHTEGMRWVLSIFRLSRRPLLLREIPLLLLKCAIWGLITGPFFAMFFAWMSRTQNFLALVRSPAMLFWAAMAGVVWALPFYIACGLGSVYLRQLIRSYPASIVTPVIVVYNVLASSLAFIAAVTVNSHMAGASMQIPVHVFWRIVVIDGLLGGVLALVIGAFMTLKLDAERAHAEMRVMEVETSRAQARALQSQINPHFFFNTLNSISALVDDDPDCAKRMIGSLADMFRYTLGCTHTESVSLDQELQFVRNYLAIEQSRFRKRLHVELPEGPLPEIRVPGLVLQPLVENAVKHGIARRIGGGTVSVAVVTAATGTRVSVRNTVEDHEPVADAMLYRAGHALENVRARLRLFTGKPEPLQVAQNSEWTEFSFEI